MKLWKVACWQNFTVAGRKLEQEKGVTGLETAIILIAFVVVASVFAFTVLSTGIFSAERGKETIHAGLRERGVP
jgi:flagellin FlaB